MKDDQLLNHESDIIIRLRKGDTVAFEQVFDTFYQPLKVFAYYELKSNTLAEDAVQDIFCNLWSNRKKLNQQYSLRGFLFTCLRNHILRTVRTRKNEILKHQRYFLRQPRSVNDTEDQIASQEIQQNIDHLINQLPEAKRNVLTLSIYQGLSNEQIAEKLQLSVHTVKIYLSQSSRELRNIIARQERQVLLVSLVSALAKFF